MSMDHMISTTDYLTNTQSVLLAGRRLRNVLGQDTATVQYAALRLERAADQQGTGSAGYRAFMFAEAERAPAGTQPIKERVTEDVLASILADLDVANVLMTAGTARGEAGDKAEPKLFDEALRRLETSTRSAEQSLANPLDAAVRPGRFGFAEDKPPEAAQSADVPAAVKTLTDRSNLALKALVDDAEGAVSSAIKALTKLDQAKVLQALSTLGAQIEELPKLGQLFSKGIEKLQAAIDSLIELLGSDTLKKIKAQIEKVWKNLQEGKYVEDVLRFTFGVEGTQKKIATVLCQPNLKLEALDAASNELPKLTARFKEVMKMIGSILGAITLAGTVLSLVFSAATPEIALGVATAYVLILATIILYGMDYTDTGLVLKRVRGVGEIVKGVQTA